ncbi:multicopper oxidase family protein [Ruania albidiflava]|uniref:multicopper oxidase family protein n=1 Tax=Ruania albidiflava TaxID=366586 RepID=UPI0003F576A1|nr:multicopper oxidase family protein [Ruania albidiflava]
MSATPPERGRCGVSRRGLLAGGAAVLAAGVVGTPVLAGWRGQSSTGTVLASRIPLPEPFGWPLTIPPVLAPVRSSANADHFELVQQVSRAELVPGWRSEVWTYGGSFPGPTIRSRRGRQVLVTHRNELPVPVAVHLHGGVTPPEHDGYPTDLILPDEPWEDRGPGHHDGDVTVGTRVYEYPNDQRAATLWYHDHRMDFTAPAVWKGLAGLHLVTDDEESSLDLPDGDRDIPLVIVDRTFDARGQLFYPSLDPTLTHTPGVTPPYEGGVLGDVILVNGRSWPRHEVDTALYRLRILNASNARRYQLRFEVEGGTDLPIVQIGSDQGLLPAPIMHDHLTLASAERFDVLVDFRDLTVGSRVRVVNDLGDGQTRLVMRFDVTGSTRDDRSVPDTLSPSFERLREADATTVRSMVFRSQSIGDQHGWVTNGEPFSPDVTQAHIPLGSTEIWELTADLHHPVHLHLAHFQVLGRGTGGPGAFDHGWKDTIDLRPAERARILARFDGYRGRYVFHCHNLEHEDMMMMANFDVI